MSQIFAGRVRLIKKGNLVPEILHLAAIFQLFSTNEKTKSHTINSLLISLR